MPFEYKTFTENDKDYLSDNVSEDILALFYSYSYFILVEVIATSQIIKRYIHYLTRTLIHVY